MSNTLLTIDMITNDSLADLENNIVFSKSIARRPDEDFGDEALQHGDTLRIRKPTQYVGSTGATISSYEDTTESYTTLTLEQFKVPVNFTSKELTLDIARFRERVIRPAMITIANWIDTSGLAQYSKIANQFGTAGSVPNESSDILGCGHYLNDSATPTDMRGMLLNPAGNASMVAALQSLFNSAPKISEQYTKGLLGSGVLGFDVAMSQNIPVHTQGTGYAAITVSGANQSGSSITLNFGASGITGALKAGDVLTFTGCLGVNPVSRQSTGRVFQTVVQADVNVSAGVNTATVSINPPIYNSGAFQTVVAVPGNGVAVSVNGGAAAGSIFPVNLAYHRNAFVHAMARMYMPEGLGVSGAQKTYNGFSIRLIRDFDIANDKNPCRIDVLSGFAAQRPEWACRLMG